MLRVGLTGGLGSGKSTVAGMLREVGFHILEADEIARAMMQPGQAVFARIAEHFGPQVVRADGQLDRARLAQLAFGEGRLGELNRIVHPPVIAEQERRMREIFAADGDAVAVVESALIFEAEAWGTAADWSRRFDRIVLVTAPDQMKIARYLGRVLPADAGRERRAAAERDARARLAAQLSDAVKAARSDFTIDNAGTLEVTQVQVRYVATQLRREAVAEAR